MGKLYLRAFSFFVACFVLGSSTIFSWNLTASTLSGSGINFGAVAAVNASGDGVAVWTTGSFPSFSIQASTYTGGVWSAPMTVSTSAYAIHPQVGIDAAGDIVVVWEDTNLGNTTINAATLPFGGSWSAPVVLSSSPLSSSPSLAMNDAGNAVAAWVNVTADTIEAATMTFPGPWSSVATIAVSGGEKTAPDVSVDTAGNAYASWQHNVTGQVFATETVLSVWTPPLEVSYNSGNLSPSMSVSGIGDGIITWENNDFKQIDGVLYIAGVWSRFSRISGVGAISPLTAMYVADAFTVWFNQITGVIEAANYSAGSWSSSTSLTNPHQSDSPAISVDGSGNAMIVWSNSDVGAVQVIEYPTGGVPSFPAKTISSGNVNVRPSVAANGATTIVVWESFSGSDVLIQANVN